MSRVEGAIGIGNAVNIEVRVLDDWLGVFVPDPVRLEGNLAEYECRLSERSSDSIRSGAGDFVDGGKNDSCEAGMRRMVGELDLSWLRPCSEDVSKAGSRSMSGFRLFLFFESSGI